MNKVRLGFVPSHRIPFDNEWAIIMRDRVVASVNKNLKEIELIVPDSDITPGGILKNEGDASKIIKLFKEKEIQGPIIGTMTFGEELPTISVAEEFNNL